MKLLMFHTKSFWYKPYSPNSSETEKTSFENCLVIFIHAEETNKDNSDVVDKAVGNIKWLANKNKTNTVILHSFAHLSNSKSDPETANNIIQKIGEELDKNLSTHLVPFGQFYEFSAHVFGPSLAKVFKDL
ncbi:MAG: threonyl-tRNA synthetase editing domain-containing protein [Patescibacteria group bacterium]|nr:threonyl-tRNA synthetase editing domain-containing protein [Patescibacteria group bacterium]